MTIWPRARRRRRWLFCGGSLSLAWAHLFSLDERIRRLGCEWIVEIKAGWGGVYFPPIGKSAMDGAARRPGWVERTRARTEADPDGMRSKRTNKATTTGDSEGEGGLGSWGEKCNPR